MQSDNKPRLNFNPEFCRNESEVESKLIVQYLMPALGYSPDDWHQEVAVGSIRLDFLAFAAQVIPFVLDADSPLGVVMEAKHPKENLDKHIRRLRRYLSSLHVRYGLLTNGKEVRIFEKTSDAIKLVFQCLGSEVETKLPEIKALIGRDSLQHSTHPQSVVSQSVASQSVDSSSEHPLDSQRKHSVKVLAVYHNKGGVGKTTATINLAAAIRKRVNEFLWLI